MSDSKLAAKLSVLQSQCKAISTRSRHPGPAISRTSELRKLPGTDPAGENARGDGETRYILSGDHITTPSNLNDTLPFIHRAASRTFGKIVLRQIFEDMVANTTDDEILTPLILTPLSENFGGDPGKKKSAKNTHDVNRDHFIQGDVKHGVSGVW